MGRGVVGGGGGRGGGASRAGPLSQLRMHGGAREWGAEGRRRRAVVLQAWYCLPEYLRLPAH